MASGGDGEPSEVDVKGLSVREAAAQRWFGTAQFKPVRVSCSAPHGGLVRPSQKVYLP